MTFLATNDVPGTELNRPFQRTMNTPGSIPGFLFYPHVGQVTIEGPLDAKGASDTASRRKIFVCRPASRHARKPRARARSSRRSPSARSAGPSTAADLKLADEFYQAGASEGGAFDDGIEAALQRILADPEFIYRGEREPASLAAGQDLSRQRPRAGVAAVVLPVEQHSRTTS